MINIYTDGSNVHNGKEWSYGGYAFIVEDKDQDHFIGGGSLKPNSDFPITNNRAELMAILDSICYILENNIKEATIYSDSQWCIECATRNWKRRKNLDLWSHYNRLERECKKKQIKFKFKWVKGHIGIELNELVDHHAGLFCKAAKPPPKQDSIEHV